MIKKIIKAALEIMKDEIGSRTGKQWKVVIGLIIGLFVIPTAFVIFSTSLPAAPLWHYFAFNLPGFALAVAFGLLIVFDDISDFSAGIYFLVLLGGIPAFSHIILFMWTAASLLIWFIEGVCKLERTIKEA